jgi:hypothetical protein
MKQIASDAQLREAYAQCNGNYAKLGRLLGYSGGGSSLWCRLHQLGLPAKGRPTLVDRTRLEELRALGYSQADLAFIFQVSVVTIRNKLAQLGLIGAA